MAARAAIHAGIDQIGGEPRLGPAVNLVPVHVDEMGVIVRRIENDIAVVGLGGVVNGDAGGEDAGLRMSLLANAGQQGCAGDDWCQHLPKRVAV